MIQYFCEGCVRDRVLEVEMSGVGRRGDLEYGVSYGEWHKHLDKGDSPSGLKADSGVIGRLCMWGAGKEGLQYIQGSFMTSSVRDKGPEKLYFQAFLTPTDEAVWPGRCVLLNVY